MTSPAHRDDPADRGPWTWAVTWGVLARPGFVVEHVVAFDADEALVLAALRRPELERPKVAFVVTAAAHPAGTEGSSLADRRLQN